MRQFAMRGPAVAEAIRVNRRPALASHVPVSERGSGALRDGGWDLSSVPVRSDRTIRIQAKLRVGQTDDPAEQEADRIADQVMRMPDPQAGPESRLGPALAPVQRDAASFAPIQTKSLGTSDGAGFEAPPIVHHVLRSPGQPLDAETRAFFEPRFGRDFSQVRLHTDPPARDSAAAIGAEAFSVEQNIVFGAGRYLPHSTGSRMLLAHELVHTIQQDSAAAIRRKAKTASAAGAPTSKTPPEDECTFKLSVNGVEYCVVLTNSAGDKKTFHVVLYPSNADDDKIRYEIDIGVEYCNSQNGRKRVLTYPVGNLSIFSKDDAGRNVRGSDGKLVKLKVPVKDFEQAWNTAMPIDRSDTGFTSDWDFVVLVVNDNIQHGETQRIVF